MARSETILLIKIITLGFGLRLLFIFISHHIYYPDEIFQTLEPAYHLVNGYGIIPWDYLYGLRSWLIPGFFSLPLAITKAFNLTHPNHYIPIIRSIITITSLVLIPAAYFLAKKIGQSQKTATVAAFSVAIWYELIYFSSRALTETLSTSIFALTFVISNLNKRYSLAEGSLLILATFIRPQYFVITLFLGYYLFKTLTYQQKLRFIAGGVIGVLIVGIVDQLTYGQFLIHLINNINLSFLTGISQEFGSKSIIYYVTSLLLTSLGLIVLSFAIYKQIYAKYIYFALIVIIIIHSLIPHKEYRFIFIAIPIAVTLFAIGLMQLLARYHFNHPARSTIVIITAVSLISLSGKIPLLGKIYPQPPLLKDPVITLAAVAHHQPNICNLYVPDRDWVFSPSYYHLGKNLPIYTQDNQPPPNTNISHLIIPNDTIPPTGYQPISKSDSYTIYLSGKPHHHPGYSLYTNPIPCQPDLEYSNHRSFPYLDPYLKAKQQYPIPSL